MTNIDLEKGIIHLLYEQNITEIFEGDQMTYTTYLAHFNDGECHITHRQRSKINLEFALTLNTPVTHTYAPNMTICRSFL